MRWWAIILTTFLLVPGVHSAKTGLYVEEHNITYTLGLDSVHVEEVITFGNRGDPFTFADNIFLQRGDASDIVVKGISASAEENYPGSGNAIKFYLIIQKGNKRTVTITYDRSDLLSREGAVKRFNGYALGQYQWLVHRANIIFITPEGYSFGPLAPAGQKTRKGNREVVVYPLTALRNLTEIADGVLVDLRYANYRDMAVEKIATAKDLIEEGEFDLENANLSMENAAQHGNISDITLIYMEGEKLLEDARVKLQLAEINNDPLYNNYYDAYTLANQALEAARGASKQAKVVENQANYRVQKALEERVTKINEELSTQSTLLNQRLNQTAVSVPEPRGGGVEADRTFIYLALVLVLVVGVVVALTRIQVKSGMPLKKGTVSDYKDIDDLKRKTFEGFEKKVDTVKKGVEVATKIRSLRSEREKVSLGIENLRKKRVSGEVTEEAFREDKAKFETRLEELDSEIIALEEELKELKQVRR
jgi:hypothetical protein